jgi:hypothetical protein
MTPRPYDPAMMNPTFFTEGRMITHSVLFKTLRGMPFGPLTNSLRTSPDSLILSSVSLSDALASLLYLK